MKTLVKFFSSFVIAFSLLLAPLVAGAEAGYVGLVKASGPAVYYQAEDGKRYAFPNEKTYRTWYADFSGIQTISDTELAALTLGGNVTYRPGVRLVKVTTDPKVYAVDARGTLRWVTTEEVAVALYGVNWAQMVDDVPDAFFTNYQQGDPIDNAATFDRTAITAQASSISVDKGLVSNPETIPTVTVEADDAGFYPAEVHVSAGERVRIIFTVRAVGVYFGGLDISSSVFEKVHGGLGEEVVVEFDAPTEPTSFSSFWPSSRVLKATGTIIPQ